MSDTDFQMVPVPSRHVPAVYRFLADLTAPPTGPDSGSTASPPPAADPDSSGLVEVPGGNGVWANADIVELNRVFRNPAGRAIFTAIAEASLTDRVLTYGDLRAAGASAIEGFNFDQVRSQLSWLAKYCKRIKEGAHQWPLIVKDLSKGTTESIPKEDRYLYRMDPRIARWWLDCVDASADSEGRS